MNRIIVIFISLILGIISINSCEEYDKPMQEHETMHTCTMRLIGSLTHYDGTQTKASGDAQWDDGSIIHLRMESSKGITTGKAVYNKSNDIWTISYYGSLDENISTACTAVYVEDECSVESSVFRFDENSAIYEDTDGSYIFEEGELVVTAHLKPKTGRMRFTGAVGQVLKIYGITHYTTLDLNNMQYNNLSDAFKITVGEDGYTPYIYGYFSDISNPNIKVWIDAKEAYTRFFSNDVFQTGQSGKLTIPTEDSHSGWAEGLHFIVGDQRFKMIAVEGGSFIMGDPSSTSQTLTAHSVTLTGFCIAETEMTRNVYNRVYESSATTETETPHIIGISYMTDLMDQFYSCTHAEFSLPSEAQWEYAAKGGVKSKGYIYSGSNILDEVAWYRDNSDSRKAVKLKLPNELGLYDMSGNEREHVLDYYNNYTADSVTDPVSTTKAQCHVVRGGGYSSSADGCTNIYRGMNIYYTTYNSYNDGLECAVRLTLNWDN